VSFAVAPLLLSAHTSHDRSLDQPVTYRAQSSRNKLQQGGPAGGRLDHLVVQTHGFLLLYACSERSTKKMECLEKTEEREGAGTGKKEDWSRDRAWHGLKEGRRRRGGSKRESEAEK